MSMHSVLLDCNNNPLRYATERENARAAAQDAIDELLSDELLSDERQSMALV